jgi:hypothetical protein
MNRLTVKVYSWFPAKNTPSEHVTANGFSYPEETLLITSSMAPEIADDQRRGK